MAHTIDKSNHLVAFTRSPADALSNATNAPARRLYTAAGFRQFGLEPRSLQTDGAWHDEARISLDRGG